MIVVGITHAQGTSKKTGSAYDSYVLYGVVKRHGEVQTASSWISPAEYERSNVKVGDNVIVSTDGDVIVRDSDLDIVKALLDRL